MLDVESNSLDLEIKSRHKSNSVIGHERHSMVLKQRCPSVMKMDPTFLRMLTAMVPKRKM